MAVDTLVLLQSYYGYLKCFLIRMHPAYVRRVVGVDVDVSYIHFLNTFVKFLIEIREYVNRSGE